MSGVALDRLVALPHIVLVTRLFFLGDPHLVDGVTNGQNRHAKSLGTVGSSRRTAASAVKVAQSRNTS